jgi:chromosome segregation ATPase
MKVSLWKRISLDWDVFTAKIVTGTVTPNSEGTYLLDKLESENQKLCSRLEEISVKYHTVKREYDELDYEYRKVANNYQRLQLQYQKLEDSYYKLKSNATTTRGSPNRGTDSPDFSYFSAIENYANRF